MVHHPITTKLTGTSSVLTMRLLLVTLHLFFQGAQSYCIGAGRNPQFTGPPIVEQVTVSLVRVSWGHNIVHDRECADQFFVKYWPKNDPYNYEMTEIVAPEINYLDIKVRPRVNYIFETIAREEKGLMGVDYNRAPHVEFQTSRRTVIPPSPPPPPEPSPSSSDIKDNPEVIKLDGNALNTVQTDKPPPELYDNDGIMIFGLSIEIFVGLFVAVSVILIVLAGGVYKCLQHKKGEHNLNMSSEIEDEEEIKGELKPLSPSIND
ncbi:unnamed protein product [Lepeophtheirus salmonis]|uniref:(salmon louse) hypothetical protein n=1 Tax=Lepeophtheirus salmonis TaxID=72036 RepID=A0A7R8CPI8_LEPSM|nr:unnamed protein product [Lepeophtheirus salmonis]CAF2884370.1 unnamed protein product [Lepeophtheirus salmonis]